MTDISLETEFKDLLDRGLTTATVMRVLGERAHLAPDWISGAAAVARAEYETDDVEIDPLPLQSRSDEGVWVSAWVHVSDTDLESYAT